MFFISVGLSRNSEFKCAFCDLRFAAALRYRTHHERLLLLLFSRIMHSGKSTTFDRNLVLGGVPKIAAKTLLNQNAVKVIPKESINQFFLFYGLKNERFKSYIIGCAQGAASQASIT